MTPDTARPADPSDPPALAAPRKETRQIKEAFIDGYLAALNPMGHDTAEDYKEARRAWREQNTTNREGCVVADRRKLITFAAATLGVLAATGIVNLVFWLGHWGAYAH